uniref:Prolamin-like domain-containing protein n=1 Tax=Kalanchoe fedtschenkoi TaxID=63787 RepID=A0A7N0ZXX7_KALFE
MTKQIIQNATASVIFSVCLAILFGLSHARELQADAPVYIDEVFVEIAPGIIEEVVGGQALVLDPLRCWAAIGDVTSCILDFLKNLGNRNLGGGVSPRCCEQFGAISDQCSFNVLPFDSSVSGSIKSICSRLPAPPSQVL